MVKKLTIFYLVLYVCSSTFMLTNTTIPFKGHETDYTLVGLIITAGFGLFYSFSLFLLAIGEVVSEADKAIEESRRIK